MLAAGLSGDAQHDEALYDISHTVTDHANAGTPLPVAETAVLSEAIADLTFAWEQLLYGPGLAPGGASGPPSDAGLALLDPDPQQPRDPKGGQPDLSAVDVTAIRKGNPVTPYER